ncbi:MAG: Mrp/NBP35 family ATP-binding protein [Candidatus Latescibacterota bacterium]
MHSRQPMPGVKDMLAVSSGKGGVGKSTIATNLAVVLARRGLRVGLMDADIYGPNIPGMLGLGVRPALAGDGQTLVPSEAHGLKAISMGQLIERGAPVIWRGPMLAKMVTQFLFGVAWGELDLMVLDLPPGTGDVQITLTQTAPLSGALIVTTPSDIALEDVRRGAAMFRQTEVPILGLVENMSRFVCHRCGHSSAIFGEGGGARTAARLGIPLLASVPLDGRLCRASDTGTSLVDEAPDSPAVHALGALADQVLARLPHA